MDNPSFPNAPDAGKAFESSAEKPQGDASKDLADAASSRERGKTKYTTPEH